MIRSIIVASGIVALALGLFGCLLYLHVRSLRYFDRPAIARSRWFDPALAAASGALVLAGLVSIGSASREWAAALSLLLLAGVGYRSFIRSVPFQRWLLRRDYDRLRAASPEVPDRAILLRLILRRHPGWGEELAEQMILDYPSLDEVARLMARMERGFRGFR